MFTQVMAKEKVSGTKCNENLNFLIRIKHILLVFWHVGLCMNALKICEFEVLKFSLGQCG